MLSHCTCNLAARQAARYLDTVQLGDVAAVRGCQRLLRSVVGARGRVLSEVPLSLAKALLVAFTIRHVHAALLCAKTALSDSTV